MKVKYCHKDVQVTLTVFFISVASKFTQTVSLQSNHDVSIVGSKRATFYMTHDLRVYRSIFSSELFPLWIAGDYTTYFQIKLRSNNRDNS